MHFSEKYVKTAETSKPRYMRCILKAPARAHIEDMLADLKWMSVKQRLATTD